MPRQLRIQYEGAIYHLMDRGDRREPIFKTDFDRLNFLHTLGETFSARLRTGQLEPRLQPPVRRKEGGVQKARTPLRFAL
ncbi:MAG TPA: hypothetical protein VFT34_10160 [Verrucomicrobiae bacterium]|nr:hypothetical protein [Verrucomicrobiae bacterium]